MSLLLSLMLTASAAAGYANQTNFWEGISILFHKDRTVSEYHTGETSADRWNETDVFTENDFAFIEKADGRDFRILNLADIHYSDFGYRIFTSVECGLIIRKLVKETKPDLITLSGDFVCGDSDWYSIRRITDMMDSFGIPWAPVFGNHDDEANCDLNFLSDIMMKSEYCLMKKGDPAMGCGNYVIGIGSSPDNLTEAVIMMDSHHSQPNEKQQKWYSWAASGIKAISPGCEISVMMHIPLPEYQFAYDEYCKNGVWAREGSGFGELHETICCDRENDVPAPKGFYDILKNTGTKYVFCSHDHLNDFSVEYEGIRLTYMLKLGKASGFRPSFNGGTVITVGSDGIKTIEHKTSVIAAFRTLEKMDF